MACGKILGNFKKPDMYHVDEDKSFSINTCEIALYDKNLWDLFCDFELIRMLTKEMDTNRSHISDEALTVGTKLCDILVSSGKRVTSEEI